ncbi:ExeM/NucH family extracellular endonuclease [Pseudanabaena biceps]|nr:ExeM/NucH family extracellular endonuclease [Pseudanabaena biceps]
MATVFINEIHYDNNGTDIGEFVEIAGVAGTNLTGWTLVLYNGTGGAAYNTTDLSTFSIDDEGNGFGAFSVSFPSNGIQNGAPDGIALVNNGTVVQFLSYEGVFTATSGAANGLTSTDIGVLESGTEAAGLSLQLTGTGTESGNFVWNAPSAVSSGTINAGQTFTSGGVTPTITGIDLSNYVRVGLFNLPVATTGTNFLAREVSAVTYNKDTDSLFVVGDGGTAIVQVSKTGQLIDSMTLTAGLFADPEGLTYIGNGQFVIADERVRQASKFTYTPNTTLTAANVQTVKLGTTIGNIGIEGITFDPLTNGFIAVKEENPLGVFQTTIDFTALTASNGSPTTVNSTDLFTPSLAGIADFADVFAFSTLSPTSDRLLLLSQASGKIVNIDRAGNVSSSLTIVSEPSNTLSVPDQQFEGLTVDKDGFLYVTSENGDIPQLSVYAPSVVPNQAPTAVVLSNQVNAIAENTSTANPLKVADISITDDGLGTNTLSLSGTDASFFTISGNALFVKAGTTLDFETKTSYSVSVNVDDTSIGTNPDASTAFALSITDVVNETPSSTTSTIFVTEVAPWSSGNSLVAADWFELTNTGSSAVNISGWKVDDSSNSFASSVLLSGITTIGAGESVIFIEGATPNPTFLTNWFGATPPANLKIGNYSGSGIGLSTGGDAINIFNDAGVLQASVTFGASPAASPFTTFDNAALLQNAAIATQSAVGVNGAFSVVNNLSVTEVGSPGLIANPVVVTPTKISAIQGSGSTAALTGIQTIEGIVTRAFLGATKLNGFYVQEEDADSDGNDATSEAIFVYDPNGKFAGSVGDKVRITGTVKEFTSTSNGNNSSLTELDITSGTVLDLGASVLPTVTNIQLPTTSSTDLERYEGMLINLSAATGNLTVTENFQLGRFGQVVLAVDGASNQAGTDARFDQYTQFNAPSVSGYAAYLAEIANRRIYLDDGSGTQNVDPTLFGRGGQPLSASNTLRSGDTVANITGVLDERFEGYRIQTSTGVNFTPTNDRPVTPPAVGGTLKIGSFNVLNYFNDLDTNTVVTFANGLQFEPRGANTTTEFNRQRDKTINAIIATGADVLGLTEIENNGYGSTSAIQDLVNGLNAIAGAGTYAFINPSSNSLGTDAISVAFIYKPSKVTTVGAAAFIPNFYGTGSFDLVGRKPLAQTFQQISTGEQFTAVINHFKSKGSSSGGVGDADAGDGQGFSNGTRTRQAQDLAAWLATNPTGTSDADYILLGDFNAYAQENPLTTLASSGYNNLSPNTNYSYVFNGQVGALDHALGNSTLASQVTGAIEWHINADEPTVLDYNTEFKSAGQVNSLYSSQPFRTSDHDPVLVGLNLNSAPTNIALSANSINENVAANSAIGTFTTTDPTIGDTFSYSFVNGTNDNAAFAINGNQLLINASPNFEAKSSYSILVRTTDGGGLSYDKALTININDVNEAPIVNSEIADLNAKQGDAFNFQIPINTFTDIDAGDILSYTATLGNGNALPNWLSFNPTTRTFSGTPASTDVGTLNVKVTARDIANATANDIFAISIANAVTANNGLISVGTPGNDLLIAASNSAFNAENNIIFTGAGDDSVDLAFNPLSRNNRVDLGSGNDTIYVSQNDRVFGSSGNDTFDALDSKGGNRISGGAGDDTFFLGTGDRALGGDGTDKFFASEGGGNLLSGGAGSDQFWIFTGDIVKSANTIIDFQIGTDVIGFKGASFGLADLVRTGNNIAVGGSVIATFTGVNTGSLEASSFVFI